MWFLKRDKEELEQPPVPLKVVGWGFIPLPGEKKRQARAYAEAKRIMALAAEIDKSSEGK